MENTQLKDKAQAMSLELQKRIGDMAKEFDEKIKELGEEYGLRLITDVTVGIDKN